MQKETSSSLYQVLSAAFCVIVVISNVISAKLTKVPYMDHFSIPVGLITYPLTFLISDLITEIYGAKKAKEMVYTALGMNFLGFLLIYVSLLLPEAIESKQSAYQVVMGLSGLRIISSLISYVVSQIADIQIYASLKRWTGNRYLWLRNNVSTCSSQIIDTILIDILYLYWGLGMEFSSVWPIMCFSFGYKIFFSIANTPLFYLLVYLTKKCELWINEGAGKPSRMIKGLPALRLFKANVDH